MPNYAVQPSVTYPSPYEWPETVFAISGITNNNVALVTCSTYSFTQEDVGQTTVIFKQVVGMTPINGQPGRIQSVISSTQFTVNIDTTFMPSYQSGGVICIVTGQPVLTTSGFQTYNTPYMNTWS